MTDRPQLETILAALDQHDPSRAAELRSELGVSTEPELEPTLLDQLRADELEAQTVAELPSPHELPLVVGLILRELVDLTDRIDALENPPTPDVPAPAPPVQSQPSQSPGQASQVVTPAPAAPAPAPAPSWEQPPNVAPGSGANIVAPATSEPKAPAPSPAGAEGQIAPPEDE